MARKVLINAEDAPIISCTIYNHETEIRRQVKLEITEEQADEELNVTINLREQHPLLNTCRLENITQGVFLVDIRSGEAEAGEISSIERSPEAKRLYDEILAKLHERADCEAALVQLGESAASLEDFRTKVVEAGDVEAMLEASKEISSRVTTIQSEILEKKQTLAKLITEITTLKNEIAKTCGLYTSVDVATHYAIASVRELMEKKRAIWQEEIYIAMTSKVSGPVSFVLCYKVCKAGWVPSYSVHPSNEYKKVHIKYFALIDQQTTENWDNVDITLVTNSACDPSAPCLLGRSKVCYANPTPDSNKGRLIGGSIHSLPPRCRPVWWGVNHETGGAHASFHLGKHSLVTNKGVQKVLITEQTFEGPVHLYAFPQADDKNVYRAAKLKNDSEYLFLPAENVPIFEGSESDTDTQMPLVHPGTDFQIYLGEEEELVVDMQTSRRTRASETSLTGPLTCEDLVYTGSIENDSYKAETVVVAVRAPRGSDETIQVQLRHGCQKVKLKTDLDVFELDSVKSLDKINPTVIILNESTERALSVNYLDAREKRAIELAFTIKKPAGKEVSPASSSN